MGFLSGAYGKLMAGKLVRDLQYQMTSVQSRLRRVTREVANMERMFSAQERNIKMQMQAQMQAATFGAMAQAGIQFDPNNVLGSMSGLNTDAYSKYCGVQQYVQQQFAMAQNIWQNTFDMMKESQLQALKDVEDDLQTQKDNLESRLKLAESEYEAKKKEEQAGAKSFTPEYTSQA